MSNLVKFLKTQQTVLEMLRDRKCLVSEYTWQSRAWKAFNQNTFGNHLFDQSKKKLKILDAAKGEQIFDRETLHELKSTTGFFNNSSRLMKGWREQRARYTNRGVLQDKRYMIALKKNRS